MGYFDHLCVEHVVQVFEHLGAPLSLSDLLRSFCQDSARLLSYNGNLSSGWLFPRRGLLQGCPLSPLAAAAVMHIWAQFSLCSDIKGQAFLDDRCYWPAPG